MSPPYRRGDLDTIAGKDERNRTNRVVLDKDNNKPIGHVWLPNGDCAAFEIRRGGPAFVGVGPNPDAAWAEVRRKANEYDSENR